MDWALAIRRNRGALERALAALFVLAGFDESGPAYHARTATLPRYLHAHALRILRAAESAIRRLIVISAREVAVPAAPGAGAVALGRAQRRDGGGEVQGFQDVGGGAPSSSVRASMVASVSGVAAGSAGTTRKSVRSSGGSASVRHERHSA